MTVKTRRRPARCHQPERLGRSGSWASGAGTGSLTVGTSAEAGSAAVSKANGASGASFVPGIHLQSGRAGERFGRNGRRLEPGLRPPRPRGRGPETAGDDGGEPRVRQISSATGTAATSASASFSTGATVRRERRRFRLSATGASIAAALTSTEFLRRGRDRRDVVDERLDQGNGRVGSAVDACRSGDLGIEGRRHVGMMRQVSADVRHGGETLVGWLRSIGRDLARTVPVAATPTTPALAPPVARLSANSAEVPVSTASSVASASSPSASSPSRRARPRSRCRARRPAE